MSTDLNRRTPCPANATRRQRPEGTRIGADPRPGRPRNAYRTTEVRFTDWALI